MVKQIKKDTKVKAKADKKEDKNQDSEPENEEGSELASHEVDEIIAKTKGKSRAAQVNRNIEALENIDKVTNLSKY
jgi:hypothetical protein